MPTRYRTIRHVQFRDTDAAGIAHFSVFFQYMEEAEHEFLRHLGMSVMTRDDEGVISWPRVSATCEFQGAVKFEDVLDIEVEVLRRGEKSVTYRFTFLHENRPVAEGQITAVCCRLDAKGPPRSISIPAWITEKFEAGDEA